MRASCLGMALLFVAVHSAAADLPAGAAQPVVIRVRPSQASAEPDANRGR